MNYKDFNLGDWIGHISGVIEDETTLDGNEMRDLVEFLTTLNQKPILDRIRTDIEQIEINGHIRDVECFSAGVNTVLHIIDKYKAEVECVYKTREGDVEELSMD